VCDQGVQVGGRRGQRVLPSERPSRWKNNEAMQANSIMPAIASFFFHLLARSDGRMR
jgi:hypothetical protein